MSLTTGPLTPVRRCRRRPGPIGVAVIGALLAPIATLILAASPAAAEPGGVITRFAGDGVGLPIAGPALESGLDEPYDVAVGADGNVYIDDSYNDAVEKVTQEGILSIFAGIPGSPGTTAPGSATATMLHSPSSVAVNAQGDVFIANHVDDQIDEVTPSGTLSIVAGGGTNQPSTVGQPATNVELRDPSGVLADASGDLYIADEGHNVVEEVSPAGTLSVIAGIPGEGGLPTNGPATERELTDPVGLALDAAGDLYISEQSANQVVKVTPTGTLSLFAGLSDGEEGPPTEGPATSSGLFLPSGLAVDSSGNLYIADVLNNVVEKVTPEGALSIFAGTGMGGAPTYGGPPTSSDLGFPAGLAIDAAGVLYIAESGSDTIERIGPTTPSAPREVSAVLAGGAVTLSFLAPVSFGTSPITGYEVSTDGGVSWQTVTVSEVDGALRATLPALAAGRSVLVRAVNGSGAGSGVSAVVVEAPAASGSSGSLTVHAQAVCRSRREETIHWRMPAHTRALATTILLDGHLYRRLSPRARSVTVNLTGREAGAVRIEIRTRSHGGEVLSATRTYHPCAHGVSTPAHPPRLTLR